MTGRMVDRGVLKFGTLITTAQPDGQTQSQVFDEAVALARAAEDLGYHDTWTLEHHFTRYGLCPSSLMMAAFLLGRTTTLRIGTAITVLPLEHPISIAEDVAMLDHLADGRLMFGVGRGHFPREYEVMGGDMSTSHTVLPESLDIVMKAWQGEIAHHGKHYQFSKVDVLPKPRTRPHPPVYVAALSPSTVEWVAERGLPIMLPYYVEDHVKRTTIEYYNDIADNHGHDPSAIDHVQVLLCHLSESREQAREEISERYDWWSEEADDAVHNLTDECDMRDNAGNYSYHTKLYEDSVLQEKKSVGEAGLEHIMRLNPLGPPRYCIDRIQQLSDETGVRHFALGMEAAGSFDAIVRMMQRVQDEVIPHVR